jgi:L-iditol 2-dehydrogenase
MKAALLKASREIEVVEVEKPVPKQNEVLIKVKSCGICGTDLHAYTSKLEDSWYTLPQVPGHEFSGEVVSKGEVVTKVSVGDRVTVRPLISCGRCYFCKSGDEYRCDAFQIVGETLPGALAEYIVAPEHFVHVLPSELSFTEGAMVEPLSVALHAASKARKRDSVAIIGAGTIGLLIMQAIRALGAKKIVVSDILDSRLNLATKLGADHIFRTTDEDYVTQVKEVTEGLGADATFEVVGKPQTLDLSLKSTRKGGEICVVGVFEKASLPFNIMDVQNFEFTVYGTFGFTVVEWNNAIDLIRMKKVNVDKLVTHKLSLAETKAGFELMSNPPKDHLVLKTHILPSTD